MTGNPQKLAEKLGISVRSVYNYIRFMKKELNAPIAYEVRKMSYYYQRICELSFKG
jgi:DNA-binding CsgD family transcriptional regulator